MRDDPLTSPALALSAEGLRTLNASIAAALARAGLDQENAALYLADQAGIRIGLSSSPAAAATRLRRARHRLGLAASTGLNIMRAHWEEIDRQGGGSCGRPT